MAKSTSVLKTVTARSSVGSTLWARAMMLRMRSVSELITTPLRPVTAMLCTWLPVL